MLRLAKYTPQGTHLGRWVGGLTAIPALSQTQVSRANPRNPRVVGDLNPPWFPTSLVKSCFKHWHCPDRSGPVPQPFVSFSSTLLRASQQLWACQASSPCQILPPPGGFSLTCQLIMAPACPQLACTCLQHLALTCGPGLDSCHLSHLHSYSPFTDRRNVRPEGQTPVQCHTAQRDIIGPTA